jgi:hypothetical protein
MFDAHRGLVADPAAALLAKADWMEETIARIDRRAGAGAPVRVIARELLGREDVAWWFSAGDYGRRNLVEAVLASRDDGATRSVSAPDRSSPSRRREG